MDRVRFVKSTVMVRYGIKIWIRVRVGLNFGLGLRLRSCLGVRIRRWQGLELGMVFRNKG